MLSNTAIDRSHDGTYAPRSLYPMVQRGRANTRSKPLAALRMAWLILSSFSHQTTGIRLPIDRAGRVLQQRIRGARTVVLSGAGALNDQYMRSSIVQWFVTGLLARIYRTRLILVGQQIGPVRITGLKRFIFNAAFGHAVLIGCRDQQSVVTARELGLPANVMALTGDEGAHVDAVQSRATEQPYLAVHFRYDRNCLFEPHLEWYAELVESIATTAGLKVVLFSMDPGQTSGDESALRALAARLGSDVSIMRSSRPEVVKGWLGAADIALGVANHFLVFAASGGVPSVGIHTTAYMQQKLEGIAGTYSYVIAAPAAVKEPPVLAAEALEMMSRPDEKLGPIRFDWAHYV